jgi:hypothetical protein
MYKSIGTIVFLRSICLAKTTSCTVDRFARSEQPPPNFSGKAPIFVGTFISFRGEGSASLVEKAKHLFLEPPVADREHVVAPWNIERACMRH